jgi:histidine triad (HIT) family protein
MMIKGLYGFSRTSIGRWLSNLLVRSMRLIFPKKLLAETSTLVAFQHPKPAYPFHVLLVPKSKIASFLDLEDEDQTFLSDVKKTVQELVSTYRLEEGGYRLIVNGGNYQEFGILHYHLVSDKEMNKKD